MKKILLYTFIGLTAVFSTSCVNEFLEVESKSSFSDDVIFSNPTYTEGFMDGVYNVFAGNNSYRNRTGMYHAFNSDTEYRPGSSANAKSVPTDSRDLISLYVTTPGMGNGYNEAGSANPWSYLYSGIEKCNLAIKSIALYGDPDNNPVMAHLLGEAYTLRAFFYFDLIKWWGDVPARFEPVTGETLQIPKSYRGEILERIVEDLGMAAEMVDWSSLTGTTQKVSKGFVKGLRARIALFAAGKGMLPEGDGAKIDYIFADESVRRGFYEIARKECADVIASGRYRLEDDFRQIFRDMCRFNVSEGRETMFQLPYNPNVRGQMYYTFGLRWDADGKYVLPGTVSSMGGSGTVNVVPTHFYDYNPADTRRDASIAPYQMRSVNGVVQPQIQNVTAFQLAKWRADYFNPATPMNNNDDGVGTMMMRYADILLMYAEADLYLGATDGADKLNEVRRRAFGNSAHDVALTLENIKAERAFEFTGEQMRKYDLMRWGELGSAIEAVKGKMRALRNQTAPYANVPNTIYWRNVEIAGTANPVEYRMELYGFNPGETADKTATDPTGGWTSVKWTDGTTTVDAVEYDRINDNMIEDMIAHGDPDQRQLLPINSVIIAANPMLSNDYGYGN